VQPGPFVPMNVVAGALAANGSDRLRDEVLPGIVGGEVVATWAFTDERGEADSGGGVEAVRDGDAIRLTGSRGFVQDAGSADHVLVVASLDGAAAQLLVPTDAAGLTIRPLSGLDLARRFAHIDLHGVLAPGDALLSGGEVALGEQLLVAIALNLAETVGAMDALFDMTVSYAKDRIAFGRPIGSFQSIKHILADQALYLEACKAVAVRAAKAVASSAEDAAEIASMAAAYVGDQGRELAQECLQVHGGIGYTWEHDLHLLMRRIESNAVLYGEPSWHRERVCALQGLGALA
jgi:alkylation response protein AidB-like acyl-CoA dehydrogenase